MTIARAVFSELLGMFMADSRLTLATLFLVAIAGGLSAAVPGPFVAGGVLLFGSLAIVVNAAAREAQKRAAR